MVLQRVPRRTRRWWPECGAWDMVQLFRALRATVLELEDAWRDGLLSARLADTGIADVLGPELYATYLDLPATRRTGDGAARRAAVHALLAQLRDEVFSIEHWGTVRGRIAKGGGPLETALDDGPQVSQRIDQVAARRFWGLGFVHEEDLGATDALARKCVRAGVRRFARDVADLGRVLRRSPVLIPSHDERRFEQLMLDILDENHPRARTAPLVEDFCQKTDLRVRYPGLDRQRGARVQIKSTANLALHEERVATIRRRDTIVILSPVTLAEFIDEQQHARAARLLSPAELQDFWRCLPVEPAALVDLSYAIRTALFAALQDPAADPRGPMAAVPPPLRHVIRTFVKDRAFLTTSALRADDGGRRRRAAPSTPAPVVVRATACGATRRNIG